MAVLTQWPLCADLSARGRQAVCFFHLFCVESLCGETDTVTSVSSQTVDCSAYHAHFCLAVLVKTENDAYHDADTTWTLPSHYTDSNVFDIISWSLDVFPCGTHQPLLEKSSELFAVTADDFNSSQTHAKDADEFKLSNSSIMWTGQPSGAAVFDYPTNSGIAGQTERILDLFPTDTELAHRSLTVATKLVLAEWFTRSLRTGLWALHRATVAMNHCERYPHFGDESILRKEQQRQWQSFDQRAVDGVRHSYKLSDAQDTRGYASVADSATQNVHRESLKPHHCQTANRMCDMSAVVTDEKLILGWIDVEHTSEEDIATNNTKNCETPDLRLHDSYYSECFVRSLRTGLWALHRATVTMNLSCELLLDAGDGEDGDYSHRVAEQAFVPRSLRISASGAFDPCATGLLHHVQSTLHADEFGHVHHHDQCCLVHFNHSHQTNFAYSHIVEAQDPTQWHTLLHPMASDTFAPPTNNKVDEYYNHVPEVDGPAHQSRNIPSSAAYIVSLTRTQSDGDELLAALNVYAQHIFETHCHSQSECDWATKQRLLEELTSDYDGRLLTTGSSESLAVMVDTFPDAVNFDVDHVQSMLHADEFVHFNHSQQTNFAYSHIVEAEDPTQWHTLLHLGHLSPTQNDTRDLPTAYLETELFELVTLIQFLGAVQDPLDRQNAVCWPPHTGSSLQLVLYEYAPWKMPYYDSGKLISDHVISDDQHCTITIFEFECLLLWCPLFWSLFCMAVSAAVRVSGAVWRRCYGQSASRRICPCRARWIGGRRWKVARHRRPDEVVPAPTVAQRVCDVNADETGEESDAPVANECKHPPAVRRAIGVRNIPYISMWLLLCITMLVRTALAHQDDDLYSLSHTRTVDLMSDSFDAWSEQPLRAGPWALPRVAAVDHAANQHLVPIEMEDHLMLIETIFPDELFEPWPDQASPGTRPEPATELMLISGAAVAACVVPCGRWYFSTPKNPNAKKQGVGISIADVEQFCHEEKPFKRNVCFTLFRDITFKLSLRGNKDTRVLFSLALDTLAERLQDVTALVTMRCAQLGIMFDRAYRFGSPHNLETGSNAVLSVRRCLEQTRLDFVCAVQILETRDVAGRILSTGLARAVSLSGFRTWAEEEWREALRRCRLLYKRRLVSWLPLRINSHFSAYLIAHNAAQPDAAREIELSIAFALRHLPLLSIEHKSWEIVVELEMIISFEEQGPHSWKGTAAFSYDMAVYAVKLRPYLASLLLGDATEDQACDARNFRIPPSSVQLRCTPIEATRKFDTPYDSLIAMAKRQHRQLSVYDHATHTWICGHVHDYEDGFLRITPVVRRRLLKPLIELWDPELWSELPAEKLGDTAECIALFASGENTEDTGTKKKAKRRPWRGFVMTRNVEIHRIKYCPHLCNHQTWPEEFTTRGLVVDSAVECTTRGLVVDSAVECASATASYGSCSTLECASATATYRGKDSRNKPGTEDQASATASCRAPSPSVRSPWRKKPGTEDQATLRVERHKDDSEAAARGMDDAVQWVPRQHDEEVKVDDQGGDAPASDNNRLMQTLFETARDTPGVERRRAPHLAVRVCSLRTESEVQHLLHDADDLVAAFDEAAALAPSTVYSTDFDSATTISDSYSSSNALPLEFIADTWRHWLSHAVPDGQPPPDRHPGPDFPNYCFLGREGLLCNAQSLMKSMSCRESIFASPDPEIDASPAPIWFCGPIVSVELRNFRRCPMAIVQMAVNHVPNCAEQDRRDMDMKEHGQIISLLNEYTGAVSERVTFSMFLTRAEAILNRRWLSLIRERALWAQDSCSCSGNANASRAVSRLEIDEQLSTARAERQWIRQLLQLLLCIASLTLALLWARSAEEPERESCNTSPARRHTPGITWVVAGALAGAFDADSEDEEEDAHQDRDFDTPLHLVKHNARRTVLQHWSRNAGRAPQHVVCLILLYVNGEEDEEVTNFAPMCSETGVRVDHADHDACRRALFRDVCESPSSDSDSQDDLDSDSQEDEDYEDYETGVLCDFPDHDASRQALFRDVRELCASDSDSDSSSSSSSCAPLPVARCASDVPMRVTIRINFAASHLMIRRLLSADQPYADWILNSCKHYDMRFVRSLRAGPWALHRATTANLPALTLSGQRATATYREMCVRIVQATDLDSDLCASFIDWDFANATERIRPWPDGRFVYCGHRRQRNRYAEFDNFWMLGRQGLLLSPQSLVSCLQSKQRVFASPRPRWDADETSTLPAAPIWFSGPIVSLHFRLLHGITPVAEVELAVTHCQVDEQSDCPTDIVRLLNQYTGAIRERLRFHMMLFDSCEIHQNRRWLAQMRNRASWATDDDETPLPVPVPGAAAPRSTGQQASRAYPRLTTQYLVSFLHDLVSWLDDLVSCLDDLVSCLDDLVDGELLGMMICCVGILSLAWLRAHDVEPEPHLDDSFVGNTSPGTRHNVSYLVSGLGVAAAVGSLLPGGEDEICSPSESEDYLNEKYADYSSDEDDDEFLTLCAWASQRAMVSFIFKAQWVCGTLCAVRDSGQDVILAVSFGIESLREELQHCMQHNAGEAPQDVVNIILECVNGEEALNEQKLVKEKLEELKKLEEERGAGDKKLQMLEELKQREIRQDYVYRLCMSGDHSPVASLQLFTECTCEKDCKCVYWTPEETRTASACLAARDANLATHHNTAIYIPYANLATGVEQHRHRAILLAVVTSAKLALIDIFSWSFRKEIRAAPDVGEHTKRFKQQFAQLSFEMPTQCQLLMDDVLLVLTAMGVAEDNLTRAVTNYFATVAAQVRNKRRKKFDISFKGCANWLREPFFKRVEIKGLTEPFAEHWLNALEDFCSAQSNCVFGVYLAYIIQEWRAHFERHPLATLLLDACVGRVRRWESDKIVTPATPMTETLELRTDALTTGAQQCVKECRDALQELDCVSDLLCERLRKLARSLIRQSRGWCRLPTFLCGLCVVPGSRVVNESAPRVRPKTFRLSPTQLKELRAVAVQLFERVQLVGKAKAKPKMKMTRRVVGNKVTAVAAKKRPRASRTRGTTKRANRQRLQTRGEDATSNYSFQVSDDEQTTQSISDAAQTRVVVRRDDQTQRRVVFCPAGLLLPAFVAVIWGEQLNYMPYPGTYVRCESRSTIRCETLEQAQAATIQILIDEKERDWVGERFVSVRLDCIKRVQERIQRHRDAAQAQDGPATQAAQHNKSDGASMATTKSDEVDELSHTLHQRLHVTLIAKPKGQRVVQVKLDATSITSNDRDVVDELSCTLDQRLHVTPIPKPKPAPNKRVVEVKPDATTKPSDDRDAVDELSCTLDRGLHVTPIPKPKPQHQRTRTAHDVELDGLSGAVQEAHCAEQDGRAALLERQALFRASSVQLSHSSCALRVRRADVARQLAEAEQAARTPR